MASLCASCCWAAPVTAAAASPSSRPDRVTLRGRSALSPAPLLKIQPGRRPRGAFFLSRCQKGPDRHFEPEPESELGREDGDPNSFIKNLDKYRDDYRAKLGLHVPPKMFCKQKDEICEHMEKILGSKNLNNNNWMAVTVCHKARSALDLASTVMVTGYSISIRPWYKRNLSTVNIQQTRWLGCMQQPFATLSRMLAARGLTRTRFLRFSGLLRVWGRLRISWLKI